MDIKELIKKLYILQVAEKGIPKDVYETLSENEKSLLEFRDGKYWLKDSERKKLRVVATGGVFDIIHAGHIYTLREAKKHGDVLVVIIARNETVERRKGRKPIHSEEYRAFIVNNIKGVDIAIVGSSKFSETIELIKPNVVVFGYDQKPFNVKGAEIIKLNKSLGPSKLKTHKIIEELGI